MPSCLQRRPTGQLRASIRPGSASHYRMFGQLPFRNQLKQFRTKRRRIRAHFGSPDNIAATALTIGQRRTSRGILGGYMLKVDARHGVKGLLPASESYFLDRSNSKEPLRARGM